MTGASGLVGGVLRDGLGDRYAIHGLDVRPGPGADAVVDATDLESTQAAFSDADAVVDLAADSDMHASWESVRENNIPATLNALEAAHRAGVRRVIFASSNHVTGMYENDEPYASILAGEYDGIDPAAFERVTVGMPIRPDGPYGVG